MTTHSFQIRQLADELQPPESGKQSIVLIDNDNAKVVLFAFAGGDGLKEHVAPLPAIIQIIKGEAELTVGQETVAGKPGTWIQMAAKTPHSIKATTPLVMLLTLLKKTVVPKQAINTGYDHHKKAGNHGDIVKHVALTAALQGLLPSFKDETFWYADTFAGYAWNPLVDQRGHEWKQGVGALVSHLQRFEENDSIQHWANCYLDSKQLVGSQYPGSSVLVRDLLEEHGVTFRISLWDIGENPINSLKEEFGDSATVYHRPATNDEEDIRNATFTFIDPPGLKTKSKRDYPAWQDIRGFLPTSNSGRLFMLWLPIKAVTMRKNVPLKPPGEDSQSDAVSKEVASLGYNVIKVRYFPGGRTIGCQIIHNLPDAVSEKVNHSVSTIVEIAGWQAGLPDSVTAFSTT